MQANSGRPWAGYWLIQVGVVLMAFGIGALLGYLAGRLPAPARTALPPAGQGVVDRAERHANSADYLTRRLTIGVSKLEKSRP